MLLRAWNEDFLTGPYPAQSTCEASFICASPNKFEGTKEAKFLLIS